MKNLIYIIKETY